MLSLHKPSAPVGRRQLVQGCILGLAIALVPSVQAQFRPLQRWAEMYRAEVAYEYEDIQMQRHAFERSGAGYAINPYGSGAGWVGLRNERVAGRMFSERYGKPEADKRSMDLRLARRRVRRERVRHWCEIGQAVGSIVGAAVP